MTNPQTFAENNVLRELRDEYEDVIYEPPPGRDGSNVCLYCAARTGEPHGAQCFAGALLKRVDAALQQPNGEMIAGVRRILAGIDSDETSADYGWWETSTGAKFGSEKLAELIAFLSSTPEPSEQPSRITMINNQVDRELEGFSNAFAIRDRLKAEEAKERAPAPTAKRCQWFGEGRGQCLLSEGHRGHHTCEEDGRLLDVATTGLAAVRERQRQLEASPAEPGGEWRPIATAPTHGKVLLWWRTCRTPSVGFYQADEDGEGWRSEGDDCIPRNQQDCTHWMPLPAPPGQSHPERGAKP